MSFSFTADEFTRIRHRARRIADDAASGERIAAALLALSERDVELARSSAANPGDVTRACIDRFAVDAQAQLRRSLDAGFVVRASSNGLEALLTAYEMRPAVIVMDVTMPVLDGIEATRLIKAVDAIREARVIACTGSPSRLDGLADRLFAAVLLKPASPDEVLATVRQHAAA